MTKPLLEQCPSAELLAAYIEPPPNSSLSLEERRRVESHLAECFKCVSIVGDASRMLDDPEFSVSKERKKDDER